MDLSKIKKIVSKEGKVIIADNDDIMVIMSFDEYEKIKSKNLGLSSVLLEATTPIVVEKPELSQVMPELSSALPEPEIKTVMQKEAQLQPDKPVQELTLDDLPF